MKTKHLFFALATMLLSSIAMPVLAQSQGLTSLVYDFALRSGWIQTWETMPLKTDLERAELHGNVVKVVEKSVASDETGLAGDSHTMTATFDQQGRLLKIVEPRTSFSNPSIKLSDAVTEYFYENGLLKKYIQKYDAEYSDGFRPQQHVHTIYYNNSNKPVKEIYQAYSYENGKWSEFAHTDEPAWTRTYNANGVLTGGMVARSNPATYNSEGLLVKITKTDGVPPTTYKWDANGHCIAWSDFSIDGMDEVENYDISRAISYNEKGFISKIVYTAYVCNSKWKHTKKVTTETYTVKYTYDAQDNWTKAVVYSVKGKKSSPFITVTRAITYGE